MHQSLLCQSQTYARQKDDSHSVKLILCRHKSFWRGTKCSQILGLAQKIWKGKKKFGTCKRTSHKPIHKMKSCAGLLPFQENIAYGIFLFPVKKNGYPGILTQSMAMKSAPIIPPRIRGFTTATFSLVTSIIGTDLNLALPFMSIAFSKARVNSYKSSPCTK